MNLDLAKYQPQIEILVSFVEGRMEGPALDAALATDEMKTLLGCFEEARYPASSNHYRQLHNKQDRTKLGGLVNSEGIIEAFLTKANIPFRSVQRYGNIYSMILKTLPDYLDPPLEFLTEKIIPVDGTLSDTQKKKLIKERLKESFKFVEKPPKWIQNPDWPIRDGRPLVFVGQIAINAPDLFHDKGTAYLFYDPATSDFETVAQFY